MKIESDIAAKPEGAKMKPVENGDILVFKVTKLDLKGRFTENTHECGSIRELRFKLAVECKTVFPCVKLYTKDEKQRDVKDTTDARELGHPYPISLFYLHSDEDVIPYLAEDWKAEEWLDLLEYHMGQGDADAVERFKSWVQGGTIIKPKMEALCRDMIRTKPEERIHRKRLDIMIRLGINARTPGPRSEKTMFHRSVELGHDEVVRAFIAAGVDVDCVKAKCAPPLVLAINHGRVDLVKILLGAGASPGRSYDHCPLYRAVETRNEQIIRILLGAKADVNGQGNKGGAALHGAASGGNIPMLRLLVDVKAQVSVACRELSYTPLHRATEHVSAAATVFLLDHKAVVDARSSRRETPLMQAALYRRPEPALALLSRGADVNARSRYGRIALHSAAQAIDYSSPEANPVIRTLVLNGSSINTARDFRGHTPLHLAASLGRAKNCTVLLEYGADVTVRNDQGQTPIDMARESGWGALATIEVLLSHEALLLE